MRGLALALGQGALLLLLGGQMLLERTIRPRGWALTQPVDPQLPIRGRYVALRVVVPVIAAAGEVGTLAVRQGRLVSLGGGGVQAIGNSSRELPEPVAFFIPPDLPDPSLRPGGERLWVELTLPGSGPPRPIRLGRETNGRIEPLRLR